MEMKILKLVFTIGLLALVTSCSKSKDEVIAPTLPPVTKPDPVKTADVYVAGWKYNSKLAPVAAFWKNGVQTELTDGTTNLARANSIYVSGTDDVYVAGKDGLKSVLWKNGTATVLSNELYSGAYSVFVSGTDVYVAGFDHGFAVVWKNGVAIKLANGPNFSRAYSVYVSGSDVYAAGYEFLEGNKTVATLWKNGVATRLSDGTKHAVAKAVFVSGTDVYVSSEENVNPQDGNLPGSEGIGSTSLSKSVIKIWKNGIPDNLTDGTKQAIGNSLFVNGNDVYVAGYENDGITCIASVWKNKIVTNAGSGLYQKTGIINANSVFVHKDDLYVVVNEGFTAKTWKNMFTANEINKEGGGATALSVFVK
ncbi:hypothetical protein [Pedobacter cryoconitis]|uniref:hypothetical protein n=1 Tax=Pedobacter cryoconitis TaxID=188932 RepID=UPI00160F220B|nr:hypothetical protein [Pedobacter cryoconitis]MBB5644302.1 hypothetical protein [Pedobacter cryoconitis]